MKHKLVILITALLCAVLATGQTTSPVRFDVKNAGRLPELLNGVENEGFAGVFS